MLHPRLQIGGRWEGPWPGFSTEIFAGIQAASRLFVERLLATQISTPGTAPKLHSGTDSYEIVIDTELLEQFLRTGILIVT
jgi:hypothetical protein